MKILIASIAAIAVLCCIYTTGPLITGSNRPNFVQIETAANHVMVVTDSVPCQVEYVLAGDTLWIFLVKH